jgi:hypothetical protein
MFRDKYGLIVQADGDGGDTCQRQGMHTFTSILIGRSPLPVLEDFLNAIAQLEVAPGVIVRHPHQEGFRSDPSHTSRDQTDALVIAAGALSHSPTVRNFFKRIFFAHLKRLFFYQNKDLPLLNSFSVWIRASRAWIFYPLLFITDFGLLVNALFIWIGTRKNADDVDDINHILRLLQAYETMSTPVSWLARKVYAKTRPASFGTLRLGEANHVMGSVAWYFRTEAGGNVEMSEDLRPIILQLFT